MRDEVNTYEKAYIDYMNGLKYKEIAEKYGVSLNTVKSWKTRYGWDRKNKKGVHTKMSKVCIQKEVVSEDVEQVNESEELTDKERLFCLHYIRCFNATKAYMKAYGTKYESAAVLGCRLLKREKIQNTIRELKQNRLNREMLSEEDIFQKYMDIAFADISDYLEWGQEEVPVMAMYGPVMVEDEAGEKVQLTQKVNVIRFKDSSIIDGTLISEVKQGKNGASIKLADRMKALDWLAAHMDLATDKQKAEIAVLQAKIKEEDSGEIESDGFLEALKEKVDDIWQEE